MHIGLLGFGVVGAGVYDWTRDRADLTVDRVLVRSNKPGIETISTRSIEDILNDPAIDTVVEVMGGLHPAYEYICAAMEAGKHVVTANKAVVAAYYPQLTALARQHGVALRCTAAVGGGIPWLVNLERCKRLDRVVSVGGIMNGTSNFIMDAMHASPVSFPDILKKAQDLGYAEADPTADVEGLDAGRKVAILASAAFNSRVTFEDVYTEGITKITATDIQYAKEMGCTIKLLGVAKDTPDGIEARVHPMLIDSNHPLATVNDSYNAVFLTGDAVQDTMFYGRGAGELPTASAVVGDIFDVVRNILWNCCGRIGCTCYRERPIKRVGEIKSKYFVRMHIENRYGTLASVASVFGNNKVSIAQMLQKRVNGKYAEIVVITDEVKERHFEDAMQILGGMSMIQEISSTIRVY